MRVAFEKLGEQVIARRRAEGAAMQEQVRKMASDLAEPVRRERAEAAAARRAEAEERERRQAQEEQDREEAAAERARNRRQWRITTVIAVVGLVVAVVGVVVATASYLRTAVPGPAAPPAVPPASSAPRQPGP